MIINVDLDGTLCSEEKTFERALAKPIPGAREALSKLREAGHTIVIYSARTWSELRLTESWLKAHDMPYDGIHLGKPVADRFIDDRAIAFRGDWGDTLAQLKLPEFSDTVDEALLRILREQTRNFIEQIAGSDTLAGPVLEVGPMVPTSRVFERMADTYVDSRTLFTARGLDYRTMDIDPASGADFVCDLLDCAPALDGRKFGAVILLSCIEHIPQIWKVPAVLKSILAPKGRAYILTPWNLRFHGPRPDCWRISDDGYAALFQSDFTIERLEKIPCPGRPLMPVGLQCVLLND